METNMVWCAGLLVAAVGCGAPVSAEAPTEQSQPLTRSSVEASTSTQQTFGVTHWDTQRSADVAEVTGVGANGVVIAKYELRPATTHRADGAPSDGFELIATSGGSGGFQARGAGNEVIYDAMPARTSAMFDAYVSDVIAARADDGEGAGGGSADVTLYDAPAPGTVCTQCGQGAAAQYTYKTCDAVVKICHTYSDCSACVAEGTQCGTPTSLRICDAYACGACFFGL